MFFYSKNLNSSVNGGHFKIGKWGQPSVVYTPELRDYHGTCSEDRLELRLEEDEKRGLIRDQDDHDRARPREGAAAPGKT